MLKVLKLCFDHLHSQPNVQTFIDQPKTEKKPKKEPEHL